MFGLGVLPQQTAQWMFFMLCALVVVIFFGAYFRSIPDERLWGYLNRRIPVPDLAVAAGEFARSDATPLGEETIRRAVVWLDQHPGEIRPERRRPLLPLAGGAGMVVVFFMISVWPVGWSDRSLVAEPDLYARQMEELSRHYELWRDIASDFEGQEWEDLEAYLADLGEEKDVGAVDQRELFRQFHAIEQRLARLTERINPADLGKLARHLGRALGSKEGWESVASAFAREDVGQAAKALQEKADTLRGQIESHPEVPFPLEENDARIFDLAAALSADSGELEWSRLFEEAAEAIRNKDLDGFCDALEKMVVLCLAEEKKRREEQMARSLLAQLEQNRTDLAEQRMLAAAADPRSAGRKMTANGDMGAGIGAGSGELELGSGWEMDVEFFTEHLQGMLAEADNPADRRQVEAEGGNQTQAARRHEEIDPNEFAENSREVIENETIPLAHRQSVRRYFELIRPRDAD